MSGSFRLGPSPPVRHPATPAAAPDGADLFEATMQRSPAPSWDKAVVSVRLIAGVPYGLSPSEFHPASRRDSVAALLPDAGRLAGSASVSRAIGRVVASADLAIAGWAAAPAKAAPRTAAAADLSRGASIQPPLTVRSAFLTGPG